MAPFLLVGVTDELAAGVPVLGAPGLGDDLGIGRGLFLMAAVLTAPIALGLVVEPFVHAWSDRVDRKPLLVGALVAAGSSLALASASDGPLSLAASLGIWGLATGIACGVAQAGLVRLAEDPSQAMTRWALGTSLGDIAAPVLVAGLAAWGLGWRAALLAAAGITWFDALVATVTPAMPPAADDEGDATASLWEAARVAVSQPRLLAWLTAVGACTLLDEIVLMLGALRLDGDPAASAVELGGLVVGDALGLLAAERWLRRRSPRAVLIGSALVSAVALAAWTVTADRVLAGTAWAVVLGASAALHWPLAKAEAFRCLPDRPGLVNALDSIVNGVDLIAPLLVGAVASAHGVEAAMLALLAQPLWIGVVAVRAGDMPGVDR